MDEAVHRYRDEMDSEYRPVFGDPGVASTLAGERVHRKVHEPPIMHRNRALGRRFQSIDSGLSSGRLDGRIRSLPDQK
jgi:hypothetical protein